MKKIHLILIFAGISATSIGQNYYPSSGPVAFGTPTSPTQNSFNLQVHGTTNYTVTNSTIGEVGGWGSGTTTTEHNGVTAAFSLTNTATGTTNKDGALLRISQSDVYLENLEDKNLSLKTGSAKFTLSGLTNRLWVGGSTSTNSMLAKFNVYGGTDNGLFIQTASAGKYGLSVRTAGDNDNALQVYGTSGNLNFTVQSKGEVYARKYITTLANIPDYVFDESYELLSMNNLREYIQENKHLPNIPSASEYEETGVDIGEMNRLLLEKVEELTLYILLLEDRMKELEDK